MTHNGSLYRKDSWSAVFVAAILCLCATSVAAESSFRGGDLVEITEMIDGDAVVAGREVRIDADIRGSLNAMGATVTVNRDVDGDARIAGQDVRINGEVDGDLTAYGQRIVVSADAELDGSADLGGGDIVLLGRIEGNLDTSGDHVLLNGRVDGDIEIEAVSLEIGPDAVLRGEVRYEGEKPAVIDPQAQLSAGLSWEGGSWNERMFDSDSFGHFAWHYGDGEHFVHRYGEPIRHGIGFGALLILLLTGGIATLALPTASAEIVGVAADTPGRAFGVGLLLLLFMPLAGMIVLSTMLGFIIGLFLLLVYLALLIAGLVAAMMMVGGWAVGRVSQAPHGFPVRMVEIGIGALAIWILAQVPVLAMPGVALLLAFGVGLATLSVNQRVAGKARAASAGTGVAETPADGGSPAVPPDSGNDISSKG